jgi:hypothetical protein
MAVLVKRRRINARSHSSREEMRRAIATAFFATWAVALCLPNVSAQAFQRFHISAHWAEDGWLRANAEYSIQEGMKRTVQVNVKMSPEDFALLKKAAEKRWPDAVMTNSGIVLGLAKIAAKNTLTTAKK